MYRAGRQACLVTHTRTRNRYAIMPFVLFFYVVTTTILMPCIMFNRVGSRNLFAFHNHSSISAKHTQHMWLRQTNSIDHTNHWWCAMFVNEEFFGSFIFDNNEPKLVVYFPTTVLYMCVRVLWQLLSNLVFVPVVAAVGVSWRPFALSWINRGHLIRWQFPENGGFLPQSVLSRRFSE